ncbi:metal-dependent transcriptional regulator [Verrucomicrobiaceae bacterium N1E253]|uniref:Metal-dependent transcriptional regulator n=1 Tax=Oceaniferula marina TaxID=2748318 RepID=A0A851GA08_9BACT|nr:metal-dependent transcriptional regulator [Oceaniferula marina]NWK54443.1 metal-dependent transcriptional regulator [Oceaniferula marina]
MNKERQAQSDIEIEDALKHLLDCEQSGGAASVDSVAGALRLRGGQATLVLGLMRSRGLAQVRGELWQLTESGRKEAMLVLRRHRLYETWLARQEGVPAEELHRRAQVEEHRLNLADIDALADQLGNPRFDPHGDPIPTREGELPEGRRISLAEWEHTGVMVIEHIEDEPVTMYRKLVQLGLYAGMHLSEMKLLDNGAVEVTADGHEVLIAPELLGMVHVAEPEEKETQGLRRLSSLAIGEAGVVYGLTEACYGPERRRLLDLGVVPGTVIRCEFTSPFGSPRSYSIRGSLFGFRDEQADKVLLEPRNGGEQQA